MALFEVVKPFRTWVVGDRMEPHMYLSPNEIVSLQRNGTIVPFAEMEQRRKAPPVAKRTKNVEQEVPRDISKIDQGIPPEPPTVRAPRRLRKVEESNE